ncbi:MAG: hypothetical protein AMXMBFR84_01330 [Candidatus Hydrogenedentota bacterium]
MTNAHSYPVELRPGTPEMTAFESELTAVLGLSNGEVTHAALDAFLNRYFGRDRAASLRSMIAADMDFFREEDPASAGYSDVQILSVRRGMAAIAAHRIFQTLLDAWPDLLYSIEVMAKYVQKNTNVEIHPGARIAVPFGIDHGHGTVIGATSEVGPHTFIYHGVTLGATGRRSRTGRRHPIVGGRVFFGNGSQVLGPSILEDKVAIASGAIVADSYVEEGVKISLNVRVVRAVIPRKAHIFGYDQENPRRYWAQLDGTKAPNWAEFERFDVKSMD